MLTNDWFVKMACWQNAKWMKWVFNKLCSCWHDLFAKWPVEKCLVDKMTNWQNDQLTKW
jgi:hypothetical protein